MTSNDIVGLVASYVYAFSLIGAAEIAGRWLGYSQAFTRKLVHIGAGMWVWGILALFDTWQIGIIPFATFILLNYVFYRLAIFRALDASDSTPGTVYFAVSITLLYALFWRTDGSPDWAPVAAGGVMAMTWGDAFASLIGGRWGRHTYRVGEHQRSWEGSLAMFLFTSVAVWLTLLYLPGSSLSPASTEIAPNTALLFSALAALVATGSEAISPAGTDNLSVPLSVSAILYLLFQL
jgi:dolichol kinase